MVSYDPKAWFRVTMSYQGTVIPRVIGRVLILAGITVGWWLLSVVLASVNEPIAKFIVIDPLGHTLIGVAVGLLIVFRNSSSYDRYWEGRKQWGSIVNTSRNLARGAAVFAGPAEDLANLIAAYALALKQHLRSLEDLEEIKELIPEPLFQRASASANPPSMIAEAMSAWIHQRLNEGRIDTITARTLEGYVATFLDCQGACERILRTPIPFAYAVHIKQLLMLYLVTLPLVIVPKMNWAAVFVVAAISFGMLGIEEAGVEIEDPFGDDPNDLPIEAICATIQRDTMALAKGAELPVQ
jgi:putative membrane protein